MSSFSIVLGVAHPYHANSYSWVVGLFKNDDKARDLVKSLNELHNQAYVKYTACMDEWYNEPSDELLAKIMTKYNDKPYARYTREDLDAFNALHPLALPDINALVANGYILKYVVVPINVDD